MQRGGPVAFKEQKRAITAELDRGNFSVRITREKEILLLLSSPTSRGGGGMQANVEGRRVRVPAIRVRTRKWLKTSAESEEGEEETFFPGRLINVPPEIDRFHEYRWQNEKFASDSWCPPGTN